MMKLKSDFNEIWHHGNIELMARDLCEKHGWKVETIVPNPCKGKGSVVLRKNNRAVNVAYELPEHPELMHDKLVGAMEAKRRL